MELLFPEIIRLRARMQIRQLKLEIRHAIPEIDECEALSLQAALLTKAECLLIEVHAACKIKYIEIHMRKRKCHRILLF